MKERRALWWLIVGVTLSFSSMGRSQKTTAIADEMVWLLVEKDTLQATLQTLPPMPQKPVTLHKFKIAIGKEVGDKLREGDHKTPEGIYFAQMHIPERTLRKDEFGEVAIPIDFPNPIDDLDHRTGSNIWLHGAGNDNRIASEKVTKGCVAFYNADILRLKTWLVPNQGIVVISKDHTKVNSPEDTQQVTKLTEEWLNSWKARDLKRYLDSYSLDFVHEGRSKKAFEEYKTRVFNSYKTMTIETDTIRVITHPKYAIALMNQDFSGDNRFHSRGRKVLYWQKNSGNWKIIRETFSKPYFVKHDLSEKRLETLNPLLTQSL